MATASQLGELIEDLRDLVGLSDDEVAARIPDKRRFTVMLMTLEQTCHVLVRQFGTEGITVVRAIQFDSGPIKPGGVQLSQPPEDEPQET